MTDTAKTRRLTAQTWQSPSTTYPITLPSTAPPQRSWLESDTNGTSRWVAATGGSGSSDHSMRTVTTTMNTPLAVDISGSGFSSAPTFTDPSFGTLSDQTATSVTYTPNGKVPVYPRLTQIDTFTYYGTNAVGDDVLVFVTVSVVAAAPNDRFIAKPTGDAEVHSVVLPASPTDPVTITPLVTTVQAGYTLNASSFVATNNVDGLILALGTEDGTGDPVILWNDPTIDSTFRATATLDVSASPVPLSRIQGYDGTNNPIDPAAAATFDDASRRLLIAALDPTTGDPPTGLFYYSVAFAPYQRDTANPALALRGMDLIPTTVDQSDTSAGPVDMAWDPEAKTAAVIVASAPLSVFYFEPAQREFVIGSGLSNRLVYAPSNPVPTNSSGFTYTRDRSVQFTIDNTSVLSSDWTTTTPVNTPVGTLPAAYASIAPWPVSLAA